MNCPKCGNTMTGGAPHCETIKVQMECHSCGHYENELYSSEELKVNQLTAATGASLKDCRAALAQCNYNLTQAEMFLESAAPIKSLRDCQHCGASPGGQHHRNCPNRRQVMQAYKNSR